MTLRAALLGSIGVLAETSDVQRRAYNLAFREAGLDWGWSPEAYREMLVMAGGQNRLRRHAASAARALDEATVTAIHARKTELTAELLAREGLALREGVAALIADATASGLRLALVTTTSRANIDAIAAAVGDALPLERFDPIITDRDVAHGKPAPDCYREALHRLDLSPAQAVAIEDTAVSLAAARAAGLACVATPGAYAVGQDFSAADLVLASLSPQDAGAARGAASALPRLAALVAAQAA